MAIAGKSYLHRILARWNCNGVTTLVRCEFKSPNTESSLNYLYWKISTIIKIWWWLLKQILIKPRIKKYGCVSYTCRFSIIFILVFWHHCTTNSWNYMLPGGISVLIVQHHFCRCKYMGQGMIPVASSFELLKRNSNYPLCVYQYLNETMKFLRFSSFRHPCPFGFIKLSGQFG